MTKLDTPKRSSTTAPARHASRRVVVIGAGPAGLACAYELTQLGYAPIVIERHDRVGGLARTEEVDGYRFDIGGHRFYTEIPQVAKLWQELLGDDLLERPRLSRIYYRGRFFRYPIDLLDVLVQVGALEGARILASYLAARVRGLADRGEVRTFEEWVIRAFGRRLFEIFFERYTEKVWGTHCDRISAEWAAQRIRKLTLAGAMRDAVMGKSEHRSLHRTFLYPRLGPGQMWERLADRVREGGGVVQLQTEVVRVIQEDGAIVAVEVRTGGPGGPVRTISADHVVSTVALRDLARYMEPAPPPAATEAAEALVYRGLIEVLLILDGPTPFPDTWIYIHEPGLRVARIQNFRNWSPELVPEGGGHSIGMEYFCQEGGDLWKASDQELMDLAWSELEALGLADQRHGRSALVIREPEAYPVYSPGYRDHLAVLQRHFDRIGNLQTIGRNGLHRYNNMDHSVLMGLFAARNVAGASHPVWTVNTARSYYETFQLT